MPDPRPIRLLIVTPRYLPLVGGVENHVREVARRLPADIQPAIITTDLGGMLPVDDAVDGIPVHRARAWPKDRDYRFAPSLPRLIADSECDLVHIQSYHTAVAPLAMRGAIGAGVPFILTFHGGGHSSTLRALLRRPQWAALRPLLARADRLVSVAEFEAADFSERLRLPRDRFVVIPNGADLPPGEPPPPARPEGPHVIGSVGRLERYKGHQRVIAAMPAVLAAEPDTELHVIGSGPYEPELRRIAERLGVAEHVHIRSIPAEDRASMRDAMCAMSLLVSMSEFETHPLSVIEAVALGRMALVADDSGLRELAERGLATPIALDATAAELADAVLDHLRHPRAVKAFSPPTWDQCAQSLASLYRSTCGRIASEPDGEWSALP